MGEAPGHHRVEQGEADRVEVRGGDVPAIEGAAVRPPALGPPRAGELRAETLGHPFGLLVGVLLDVATVGGDGDEVRLGTVVVQPLDQLTGISGVRRRTGPDRRPSCRAPPRTPPPTGAAAGRRDPCARPSPSSRAAARSRCRARTRRCDGFSPAGRGPLSRDASTLAAGAQCSRWSLRSVLGVERLLDRHRCCGHGGSPSGPSSACLSRAARSSRNTATYPWSDRRVREAALTPLEHEGRTTMSRRANPTVRHAFTAAVLSGSLIVALLAPAAAQESPPNRR